MLNELREPRFRAQGGQFVFAAVIGLTDCFSSAGPVRIMAVCAVENTPMALATNS
jgi:hypothetical protein